MSLSAWNERIAIAVTDGMSTMTCAYLFLAWSLLPLLYPATEMAVAYISQAVVQLVALSIIMVGGKVSERAIRRQASEDHQMLLQELALLRRIAEKLEVVA